jgi:hypothetical protein
MGAMYLKCQMSDIHARRKVDFRRICQTMANVASENLTERITVRVSQADLAAVERYAKKMRLQPSDIFRMGTMAFLQDQEVLGDSKAGITQTQAQHNADIAKLQKAAGIDVKKSR